MRAKKLTGLFLIMAIVAALLAVAIPKFIDITTEAEKAKQRADAGATRAAEALLTLTALLRATSTVTLTLTPLPTPTSTLPPVPTKKPKGRDSGDQPPAPPSCSVEPNNSSCVNP